MPRGRVKKSKDITIEAYAHKGKRRKNNPPVGLVSSATDKLNGRGFDYYNPFTGKIESKGTRHIAILGNLVW